MQTPLVTFTDVVEEVLDANELGRTELNLRSAIRAVQEAYRWLSSAYDWSYYKQRIILATVASYSTGTVVFDYTGGANERMVTLTDGTWPSWAAFGRITISGTTYTVSTRESDSIITLSANSTPAADIASTTYTLFRDTYPLPVDFKRMTRLMDVDNEQEIELVTDGVHQVSQLTTFQSPGTPLQACIRADSEYYGSLGLVFSPPPSAAREYDLLYDRQPRPLNIEKYSTGTVTISGSSTTVTGTGTTFPEDCVGSIIRVPSSGTTEPTSVAGTSANVVNRYYAQRAITARASATSLTIDSTVSTAAVTGVAYVISDPIDIEHHSMYGALRALAFAEYARLARRAEYRAYKEDALREYRLAREADSRAPSAYRVVPYNPFTRTTQTEA